MIAFNNTLVFVSSVVLYKIKSPKNFERLFIDLFKRMMEMKFK